MGIEKCDAVVLRFADYKEADRMLTLFSRQEGKISAAIKGVKKQKSKLRNGAELFALGEYTFNDKAGRLTVTGYDLMDTFYPLREDIVRLWCATLCVNAVETVATSQPEPELFDTLVFALSQLAYNEKASPLACLDCFFIGVLSIGGIFPVLNACACSGEKLYYSPKRNGFVCRDCKEPEYIRLDEKCMGILKNEGLGRDELFEMLTAVDEASLKGLYRVLVAHASYCLDKHFKSADFLDTVLFQ